MTSGTATFREARAPAAGVRRFVLDCPHGTTTADLIGVGGHVVQYLEFMIVRHVAAEGCRCASTLRPRLVEARA
jgi:hypothetical protein